MKPKCSAAPPSTKRCQTSWCPKRALGRKEYLFVGHPKAGQDTAVLYPLVASREVNGVNPEEHLAFGDRRLEPPAGKRSGEVYGVALRSAVGGGAARASRKPLSVLTYQGSPPLR